MMPIKIMQLRAQSSSPPVDMSFFVGMRHASNDANQELYEFVSGAWEVFSSDHKQPWISAPPLWSAGGFLIGKMGTITFKWAPLAFQNRTQISTASWAYLRRFGTAVFFFGSGATVTPQQSLDALATDPVPVSWGGRRINGIGRLPSGRWVTFLSPTTTARTGAWTDEEFPTNWNNVSVPRLGDTTNGLYLLATAEDRVFYVANTTAPVRSVHTLDGITWAQGGQLSATGIGATCQSQAWPDGRCLHVTTSGQTFSSSNNGINWTAGPVLDLGGTGSFLGGTITRSGDRILFCGAGSSTKIYYTDDFGASFFEVPPMPQPGLAGSPSCVLTETL